MNHREAVRLLPDFGDGSLQPTTERALSSHVEQCPECRDWLAARDLLVDGLSAEEPPRASHPEADELARRAASPHPERVGEEPSPALASHLEACARCRADLALMRAALRQARPPVEPDLRPEREHPIWGAALPPAWRLPAVAASVVLLVTAALAVLGHFQPSGQAGSRGAASSTPSATTEAAPTLPHRDPRPALEGTEVIKGNGELVVSEVTVRSGAHVTFQADHSVAFGNGFEVAAGARIVAGSTTKSATEPPGREPEMPPEPPAEVNDHTINPEAP